MTKCTGITALSATIGGMLTDSVQLPVQLHEFTGPIASSERLSGGDTSEVWHLQSEGGEFVLKLANPASDRLPLEAECLRSLAATRTVTTPTIIAATSDFLLLPYIRHGTQGADYWHSLARQLAAMHSVAQAEFGFLSDNYCGLSPQINTPMQDGHQFFAECRLLVQAARAEQTGLLQASHRDLLEAICRRLPELIPDQSPALLHGDLWAGNHFADEAGAPVLIDPACYCGWPEADLAMMTLFGQPPPRFFDTYKDYRTLIPGWQERLAVYNLYHLLNHLNLFGRAYLRAVEETLRRFS